MTHPVVPGECRHCAGALFQVVMRKVAEMADSEEVAARDLQVIVDRSSELVLVEGGEILDLVRGVGQPKRRTFYEVSIHRRHQETCASLEEARQRMGDEADAAAKANDEEEGEEEGPDAPAP